MHVSKSSLVLLALATAACTKPDPAPGTSGAATPVPSSEAPPASASAVASASASPSASALASASAPASASALASAPASASAKPSASAKTAASASPSAIAAVASASAAPPPQPLKPAAARITGKNFTLDVATPGCRVDTPCTMTLRLTAAGEFHVNKEYPYKFVATAAPTIQFLASGEANTFSRTAGDFREEGEKAGTMTVRFKPSAAGEARVQGTYKMSVCSAEACQIETPTVSLAVPVL